MRERILEVMRQKGYISMAQLEREAGVPGGTMRNMGQGHMPSMDKVRKIANTLGVTVDYIVNGTEEIKKEPEAPQIKSYGSIHDFFTLVASLSDQNMEALFDYLRYLVAKQERD